MTKIRTPLCSLVALESVLSYANNKPLDVLLVLQNRTFSLRNSVGLGQKCMENAWHNKTVS